MTIVPDQYYHSDATELLPIAKPQTWAAWRHQKKGPAYVKAGSRVLYKGADILSWLAEAQRARWALRRPKEKAKEPQ